MRVCADVCVCLCACLKGEGESLCFWPFILMAKQTD